MERIINNLSAIITIFSFILSFQSYYYDQKILSLLLFCCTIFFLFFFLYKSITKYKKFVIIDGIKINNVKISRKCKSVLPIYISNKCIVHNSLMEYIYVQEGVCIDKKGIDNINLKFHIDDCNFNNLNAFSYDLKNDIKRQHKLKASINKFNSENVECIFNFKKFVHYNNSYKIECHFIKPARVYPKGYFYSWNTFESKNLETHKVSIEFVNETPKYVKVYDANGTCMAVLDRIQKYNISTYNYIEKNCNSSTIRILFYERDHF